MAFIRWKKNKHGMRHAYLVHSYRDEQGRVRQKVLAYAGKTGELHPDKLEQAKQKHGHLSVRWDAIAQAARPGLRDIATLSDAELLSNLRGLRKERGINTREMLQALLAAGLPPRAGRYGRGKPMSSDGYFRMESHLEEGRDIGEFYYSNPAVELVPYLRRVLSCST